MQKKPLISIGISIETYQAFCHNILELSTGTVSEYICVANVHMLVEAHKNKDFAALVNGAVITTPDGLPLTWALKWFHGIDQERVSGMDLLPDLLAMASLYKVSVYFYGNTEDVLEATQRHIGTHYPDIPYVGGYSPPFRRLLPEEEQKVIEEINTSGARLIFVSLGCPKQEKWMASMKGRINGVMIGIGAALPVLIGERKRAPKWMQKKGLEWFFRLSQEPKRLFKRYFITNSYFIYLLVREKVKN